MSEKQYRSNFEDSGFTKFVERKDGYQQFLINFGKADKRWSLRCRYYGDGDVPEDALINVSGRLSGYKYQKKDQSGQLLSVNGKPVMETSYTLFVNEFSLKDLKVGAAGKVPGKSPPPESTVELPEDPF